MSDKVTKERMEATLATLLKVYIESNRRIPKLERDLEDGAVIAIRALIEHGPEVGRKCECENYEWLIKELECMAVFMELHGQGVGNRGAFKFCPYCGKLVTVKK